MADADKSAQDADTLPDVALLIREKKIAREAGLPS